MELGKALKQPCEDWAINQTKMKNADGWLALVYSNTQMLASHFPHSPINTPQFLRKIGRNR